MKRMLVATMVLGIAAAMAPAAITRSVSFVGSYNVSYAGKSASVNVYDLGFDAGSGVLLGSIVLDIGTSAGLGGDDPFQGGVRYKIGATWYDGKTPTQDDVAGFLDPNDGTNLYQADTRFLPAGIGAWAPAVVLPTEGNDKSIYNPGNVADFIIGKGSLTTAVAVPVEHREQSKTIARIGVIAGTTVWAKSGSADEFGVVTFDNFIIPEPATLSLLGLGALALIRRRRN